MENHRSSNREIERKWLLHNFPQWIPDSQGTIYQSYLSINPEVRLRHSIIDDTDNYFITIKSVGTLNRIEVEKSITSDEYSAISSIINKSPIIKKYSRYSYDGHTIEVSFVDDTFIYAEVEFNSESDAQLFKLPFDSYLTIREITEDPYFKMGNYWMRTRLLNK